MISTLGELKYGLNKICEEDGKFSNMLMDIGVLKLKKDTSESVYEQKKEVALLLITGKLEVQWSGNTKIIERASAFDENPWCLHVPRGVKVSLEALEESEIIIQRTENNLSFDAKLYSPSDCRCEIFGEGEWNGTARRIVRTVFDYENAPYSNLVIGEVITFPGKWSSYPPHHHPQPEVYYYKFDRPQGFGLCLLGDKAYKITNNSFAAINGGLVHPQTSAPGYAMYYCWMIRHLKDNPWRDRILDENHAWLCEKNVKIWPEK